jgi:antitoxin VapB
MLRQMSDSATRHVKIFRNGRNQAVRIPREFELPGEDAIMRKDGERLIIEPVPPTGLLALDDEFPEIVDSPPEPVDI